MLVAPLWRPPHRKQGKAAWGLPHEDLPFWLVRWLFFRLMFSSGVVKLTSRCPTWWGLTGEGPLETQGLLWGSWGRPPTDPAARPPAALTYHYETQCLPTPAAWYAHHLPVWLHKLSVVATFLIEVAVPPLFFAPVRRLRLAAFYSQVGQGTGRSGPQHGRWVLLKKESPGAGGQGSKCGLKAEPGTRQVGQKPRSAGARTEGGWAGAELRARCRKSLEGAKTLEHRCQPLPGPAPSADHHHRQLQLLQPAHASAQHRPPGRCPLSWPQSPPEDACL